MVNVIHADSDLQEISELAAFSMFDSQIHSNNQMADNTFSLEMPLGAWQDEKIMRGDFIYINNTEFGGIVCSVNKNTSTDTATIKGTNWRGLLAMRIIQPPDGEAYQVYENIELNALISAVVGSDYGGLFVVSSVDTGTTVSCQFRYQTKLAGLSKVLNSVGYSLSCIYDAVRQHVILSARQCVDYSDTAEISEDLGINVSVTAGRVDDYNHCIALGTGELTERMVREIWLYNGEIYREQPAGLEEEDIRSMIFDYPNAESEDELLSSAESELMKYAAMASMEADLSQLREDSDMAEDLQLDDIILAIDSDLGIQETKKVSQRILSITTDRGQTIRTEVD